MVTLGGDRKVKESPLGVVTYMSTSRDEDLNLLKKSLEALSRNFLRRYPYPVRRPVYVLPYLIVIGVCHVPTVIG